MNLPIDFVERMRRACAQANPLDSLSIDELRGRIAREQDTRGCFEALFRLNRARHAIDNIANGEAS